ncbi:MAG TPA: hypothetical protein VJ044_02750, partial [Candidatus Hodarchaeales archaeon]|nr:hypothetical protein [Candidatus Hodarchaeales archaeon]
NFVDGTFTGKSIEYGGSLIRPEATGYGTVYFCEEMIKAKSATDSFKGKKVAISGSGNVAQYACEKAMSLGAKVLTLSDSDGAIHDPNGLTPEKLKWVIDLKEVRRGRIKEYTEKFSGSTYHSKKNVWGLDKFDVALPSATQNEITINDAMTLVNSGVKFVAEGANMPTDLEATNHFIKSGVAFGPGKAANAGGVATSGLEMQQNSMRLSWNREEVDSRLKAIMVGIHKNAYETAKKYGSDGNYVIGANTAGFLKVAKAMMAHGLI